MRLTLPLSAITVTAMMNPAQGITESIPTGALTNVYNSCMKTAPATLGSLAKAYCTCKTNEVKVRFTLREFVRMEADMRDAQADGENYLSGDTPIARRISEIIAHCQRTAAED